MGWKPLESAWPCVPFRSTRPPTRSGKLAAKSSETWTPMLHPANTARVTCSASRMAAMSSTWFWTDRRRLDFGESDAKSPR